MSGILLSLLQSLLLTLTVELFLAFALGVRHGKDLFIVALVNLLTNPVVNYCSYWAIYFFTARSVCTVLIMLALELSAVFVEFLIYRRLLTYDRIGKLKLSFLLNGASFLMGVLIVLITRLIA